MLPSHTSAGKHLNVVTNDNKCIDDNNCDTSNDDDDEDNHFLKHHQPTPVSSWSTRTAPISLVSATMPPKSDGMVARRPTALNLTPIITNREEFALNLNFDGDKETSEIDGRTRNDTHKRMTIAFNNIKYTVRGRLFWKRGEFLKKKLFFAFTKKTKKNRNLIGKKSMVYS